MPDLWSYLRAIVLSTPKKLSCTEGYVDYTFKSRIKIWNKYLDLTGKGLLHYLREIRSGRLLVIQDF